MHYIGAVDAYVIDTPGIRVFRLSGINKAELRDAYPELARYGAECRFPDCSHDHEPGCAVFAAVERGELAPTRYASYVEILDELVPSPMDDTPVPPPDADPVAPTPLPVPVPVPVPELSPRPKDASHEHR